MTGNAQWSISYDQAGDQYQLVAHGLTSDGVPYTGHINSKKVSCDSVLRQLDYHYDKELSKKLCSYDAFYVRGSLKYLEVNCAGVKVSDVRMGIINEDSSKCEVYSTWYANGTFHGSEMICRENGIDWTMPSKGNEFYRNGNLKTKYYVRERDTVYVKEEFYPSGVRKKYGEHKPDKGDYGVSMDWYENGQLESWSSLYKGQQPFIYLNLNGDTSYWGNFYDQPFYLSGRQKYFHDNGNVKEIQYYELATSPATSNIKTGTWKFYNKNGVLVREEKYEKGELISEKSFELPRMKSKN